MKVIKIWLCILPIFLYTCSVTFAAPAGNPSDPKMPRGASLFNLNHTIGTVKMGFDIEYIKERSLKSSEDIIEPELKGDWYLVRLGYPMFEGILEPYLKLGVSELEIKWQQYGSNIVMKGDVDLAWGLGAQLLVYEIPDYDIKFTIDGQYRATEPDIDDVSVNIPSRSVTASDFDVRDWQIVAIASMELPLNQLGQGIRKRRRARKTNIYTLVPYVGLGYSNTDIDGRFTYNGVDYDIGDARGDDKLVLLGGCNLVFPENASVNVEARLISEVSMSGGATFKF